MLSLDDHFFFPKQDDVVCYFLKTKWSFYKKKITERSHVRFGFGKWIVSPKALDGYVVSFVALCKYKYI